MTSLKVIEGERTENYFENQKIETIEDMAEEHE
jgi:hypothetical protein